MRYAEGVCRAYWTAKDYSSCPTTQNGVHLRNDYGKNMWYGWNDAPLGWDHEPRVNIHAEVHALVDYDRSPCGMTMFAVWASCDHCAACIASAGIRRLVRCAAAMRRYHPAWDDSIRRGDEILRRAGVEIVEIEPDPDLDYPVLRFRGRPWHPIRGFLDDADCARKLDKPAP